MQKDMAEIVALKALAFLAEDRHRIERFLSWTGLGPDDLRAGAASAAVQGGVLDYLLAHEALLVAFAGSVGVGPDAPAAARRALAGRVDPPPDEAL